MSEVKKKKKKTHATVPMHCCAGVCARIAHFPKRRYLLKRCPSCHGLGIVLQLDADRGVQLLVTVPGHIREYAHRLAVYALGLCQAGRREAVLTWIELNKGRKWESACAAEDHLREFVLGDVDLQAHLGSK